MLWVFTAQAMSGRWGWPTVAALDTVFLALGAYLFLIPTFDLRASFTEEGIRKSGLTGSTFIRWDDVQQAELVRLSSGALLLKVRSSTASLQVNLLVFKDPDVVLGEVRKRLPPHLQG